MARIARVVIPNVPHHITQRGNRQQPVFFNDGDYKSYLDLMAEGCRKAGVDILAYALLPTHIHMIAVPPEKDALRAAIADSHRRYARRINAREDSTGHLWQDRFASFPVDEPNLLLSARFIESAPVLAGLAATPESYRWSSASAHLSGQDDLLVRVRAVLDAAGGVAGWKTLLESPLTDAETKALKTHETTGRPLGSRDFMVLLEKQTGRKLAAGKRGPKQKA